VPHRALLPAKGRIALISTENNTAKQSLIPVFCVRLLLIALPHLVVFGSLNDGAFASAAKPASYPKPPTADKVLKGKVVPYALWFDDRKWQQRKPTVGSHEYYFEHVDKDAYGSTV
jgi:hypothetical protein